MCRAGALIVLLVACAPPRDARQDFPRPPTCVGSWGADCNRNGIDDQCERLGLRFERVVTDFGASEPVLLRRVKVGGDASPALVVVTTDAIALIRNPLSAPQNIQSVTIDPVKYWQIDYFHSDDITGDGYDDLVYFDGKNLVRIPISPEGLLGAPSSVGEGELLLAAKAIKPGENTLEKVVLARLDPRTPNLVVADGAIGVWVVRGDPWAAGSQLRFDTLVRGGVDDMFFENFDEDAEPELLAVYGERARLYDVDNAAAAKVKTSFGVQAWPRPPVDIDDDGDLDLLSMDHANRRVVVYRNDGTGRFAPELLTGDVSDLGSGPHPVRLGAPGVTALGFAWGYILRLVPLGDTTGAFVEFKNLPTDLMADLDGDGMTDFAGFEGRDGRLIIHLSRRAPDQTEPRCKE